MYFGAWVELADDDGTTKILRIVGGDETDAAQGGISVDSPLAKALLKKQVGDIVKAQLPRGEAEWEVLAIRYAV